MEWLTTPSTCRTAGNRTRVACRSRAKPCSEFVRPDHVRIRCELRDEGEWGFDVQFLRSEEFWYSRRFETRALAVQWAEEERKALEA